MEEDKPPQDNPESTSLEPAPEGESKTSDSPPHGEESETQSSQPIAATEPDMAGNQATTNNKKNSGLKALFHRVNYYLLIFVFLILVGVGVTIVTYFNAKKQPPAPDFATQNLTQQQLKQLANSNATVGGSGKTLTIQGNAIISGQELVKGDLNVAGNVKLGGNIVASNITAKDITSSGNLLVNNITAKDLTASGSINLGPTQTQKLQVSGGLIVKDDVTLQKNLNVAGSASFNGTITASSINVTNLTISGSGGVRVPNHISFPGASPSRLSISHSVLGGAGSASISGSDSSGTINVNTGSGTQPGCFITLKFSQPFASSPHVLITPVGSGGGKTEYYVTRSSTQMQVCSANAMPTHARFAFDYFITG